MMTRLDSVVTFFRTKLELEASLPKNGAWKEGGSSLGAWALKPFRMSGDFSRQSSFFRDLTFLLICHKKEWEGGMNGRGRSFLVIPYMDGLCFKSVWVFLLSGFLQP